MTKKIKDETFEKVELYLINATTGRPYNTTDQLAGFFPLSYMGADVNEVLNKYGLQLIQYFKNTLFATDSNIGDQIKAPVYIKVDYRIRQDSWDPYETYTSYLIPTMIKGDIILKTTASESTAKNIAIKTYLQNRKAKSGETYMKTTKNIKDVKKSYWTVMWGTVDKDGDIDTATSIVFASTEDNAKAAVKKKHPKAQILHTIKGKLISSFDAESLVGDSKKVKDDIHKYYVTYYEDVEGWSPAEGGGTFFAGKRYKQKWGPYSSRAEAMKALENRANQDTDDHTEVRIFPEQSMAVVIQESRYGDTYSYYYIERDDRWGRKQTGGGGWDWSPERDPIKHPSKKVKDSPWAAAHPKYFCEHCFEEIEKEYGPQDAYLVEGFENNTVCDRCGDDGFDRLYETTDEFKVDDVRLEDDELEEIIEEAEENPDLSMSIVGKDGEEIFETKTFENEGEDTAIQELVDYFTENPEDGKAYLNNEVKLQINEK